jgi:hypothetical protein
MLEIQKLARNYPPLSKRCAGGRNAKIKVRVRVRKPDQNMGKGRG